MFSLSGLKQSQKQAPVTQERLYSLNSSLLARLFLHRRLLGCLLHLIPYPLLLGSLIKLEASVVRLYRQTFVLQDETDRTVLPPVLPRLKPQLVKPCASRNYASGLLELLGSGLQLAELSTTLFEASCRRSSGYVDASRRKPAKRRCGGSAIRLSYNGADFVAHMSAHMSQPTLSLGFGNVRSVAVVQSNSNKGYRVIWTESLRS